MIDMIGFMIYNFILYSCLFGNLLLCPLPIAHCLLPIAYCKLALLTPCYCLPSAFFLIKVSNACWYALAKRRCSVYVSAKLE